MKKYIKSASSEELQRKLDKTLAKESESKMIEPTVQRIMDRYSKVTGFECRLDKYYYRSDLDAVLLVFTQYYNRGSSYLTYYTSPGKAKESDPAMISIDASDLEVADYVNYMVDKLVERIQRTFNTWSSVFPYVPGVSDTEHQVDVILQEATLYDESVARNFIYDLIDSGEVVNNLDNFIAEGEEGIFLVDENGEPVNYGQRRY